MVVHRALLTALSAVGYRHALIRPTSPDCCPNKSCLSLLLISYEALVVVKTLWFRSRQELEDGAWKYSLLALFKLVSPNRCWCWCRHSIKRLCDVFSNSGHAWPWDRCSVMKSWLLAVTNMDCLAGLHTRQWWSS